MIQYIDDHKIDLSLISTDFPNTSAFKYMDLSNRNDKFANKNLEDYAYFFYSNVYNNLSDDEFLALEKDWEIEKEFYQWPICTRLYKKKK